MGADVGHQTWYMMWGREVVMAVVSILLHVSDDGAGYLDFDSSVSSHYRHY